MGRLGERPGVHLSRQGGRGSRLRAGGRSLPGKRGRGSHGKRWGRCRARGDGLWRAGLGGFLVTYRRKHLSDPGETAPAQRGWAGFSPSSAVQALVVLCVQASGCRTLSCMACPELGKRGAVCSGGGGLRAW